MAEIRARFLRETEHANERLSSALRQSGAGANHARALTAATDRLLSDVARTCSQKRAKSGNVSIVALGGYGRGELAPKSDIDLLLLLGEPHAEAHGSIEEVLYVLWDLGLEVGHAVRTVPECIDVAKSDVSTLTSLLEARWIAGLGDESTTRANADALRATIDRELLCGPLADAFIDNKLQEAERRRVRYGDTLYLLEPDVKHGEGGLRDFHTAMWISRVRWRVTSAQDLLRIGVLSSAELRAHERAYDFLLRIRAALHLDAKRRRDSLGFDSQEALAPRFGSGDLWGDEAARLRSTTERFMRNYYFQAGQNARIATLVIERATAHPRARPEHVRSAPGDFRAFGSTLTVSDRDQFARDPSALMRIFKVSDDEALPIYSYTKTLITENLQRLDRAERRSPAVVASFLAMLENPRTDGMSLVRMHELGVLRRFIPELTRITARWQHSLYHAYTVDIHSLFVVRELKRLRLGTYAALEPELTRAVSTVPRLCVLLLAALLHDVGKGWRGEDHAARGERVARTVGRRLEDAALELWTSNETRDLVWLVEHHLKMSEIAQRRDLSDRKMVREFAATCENHERLTMLWLLTFADMRATSPSVWNAWKRRLLFELFEKARDNLDETGETRSDETLAHVEARRMRCVQEIEEACRLRDEVGHPRETLKMFIDAMPERYVCSVPARRMRRHIEPWLEVSRSDGLALRVRHLRRERMSELTVVCPDRPGLLALLAGTMASNHLQIVSADIFSVRLANDAAHSAALDIVYLRDSSGDLCEEAQRWTQVREDLQRIVVDGEDVRSLIQRRTETTRLPLRARPRVDTKVVVAKSEGNTNIIDVYCQDHLGALYTIAQTLAEEGVSIRSARISTQGDQVADGFYVTDALTGEKIEDEARLMHISQVLTQAIERRLGRS